MLDTIIATQDNLLDFDTAKNMAEWLNEQYPGHLWAVNVKGEQGIATVHNLMLSGQWGFILKLDKNYSASDFRRRVIKAGGELLERYNVRRGVVDQAQLAALPMDFAGRTVGDFS